ncbi:MAG: exodeoxyribonuclease V subunit beta [Pigmentiphaga sp.]|nr:exodeoxyribonuclease V subunit beta [Pigmentiphaga sp.]
MNVAATPASGVQGAARPLDALRFPLRGSHLIEASAGTGKTYTIATLYVRLVLGHGGENAYARELTPPEILVVTFTEAATRELRDRIRRRLAEAAAAFRAPAAPALDDALLQALREEYPESQWPGCARRLALAAEWMDEAAVHTIHGWCYRMLREHAFDSGSLFQQELEADTSSLLLEVAQDYWRTWVVMMELDTLAAWRSYWSEPEALAWALQPRLTDADALPREADGPSAILAAVRVQREAQLAVLKQPWQDLGWIHELQELLDQARTAKAFRGTALNRTNQERWLAAIAAWAADPEAQDLDLKTGWQRLTPAGLAEIWLSGEPPGHPALEAIAALQAQLAALPEPRGALYSHAMHWCVARLAQAQRQRAQLGFDGLLRQFDEALRSESGPALARRIRQAFPIALIDEFQDTDALQYRIFDTIYGVARHDPATALVLIGDPKQAIYAFRGADIHTYLQARADCGDRLYTLDRNFRSTAAAVAAVNQLFSLAEARGGGGAFQLTHDGGPAIPFLPVQARGLAERLLIDDETPAGLTLWYEADAQPAAETQDTAATVPDKAAAVDMAEASATQVARWLNLAQEGRAGFANGKTEEWRALTPADIAILVNTGTEARRVRAALARRGVRSVYLSDRSSVYHTAEAADVQRCLQACAEPERPGLVRAALATRSLGLDWRELLNLQQDELAWEARVQQFFQYRQDWRRLGVLPMLHRLLHDFAVPARLLRHEAGEGGERRLTDWLHLTELLQAASTALDGEQALIRYLAEQRAAPAQDEGHQLRLESDADCVRVVTVHKSKGLEYPLVLLPFGCAARSLLGTPRSWPLVYRDGDGGRRFLWRPQTQAQATADGERLAEDVRKLYVALTRARHATWVGMAPAAADWRLSALGSLLDVGRRDELLALANDSGESLGTNAALCLRPVADADAVRHRPPLAAARLGPVREARRQPSEPWWVASYSALALRTGDTTSDSMPGQRLDAGAAESLPAIVQRVPDDDWDTPEAANWHEDWPVSLEEGDAAGEAAPTPPAGPDTEVWHAFPRGPEAGIVLHQLLESLAAVGFGAMASDPAALRDRVARIAAPRGLAAWIDPLASGLEAFLRQAWPLPGARQRFTLAGVEQCLVEMEFWLPVHRTPLDVLDAAIRGATLQQRPRPELQPGRLNGMLKGFIDLVFVHEGRYYVADYKSNWLGRDASAYTDEALAQTMAQSRYDVQAMLYLLALHRLLRTRLPDYDYDQHLGGAVYWFLRGLSGPARGQVALRPSAAWMAAFDDLFKAGEWRLTGGAP